MTNKASSSAIHTLTSRITDAEDAVLKQTSLAINLGEAIEPLRMGGVTFYGESARVIRDAQAVLQAVGAGQLKVVKRESREGTPLFVIDGQVFINEAEIKSTTFEVKVVRGANGHYYAAGIGVGVEQAADRATEAPVDADQLLGEITKQITESKLVASLESRIAEIGLQEQVRQIIRDELKPGGILKRG
ncbi:hypothetical protein [Pseudomonas alabamensis]|uniref:hypothetical protein n=1 Tax=Pseudomonas alabamensis TaxID=3064349 RepID=UPI003F65422B